MHNVTLGPGGTFAYRPRQLLVPQVSLELVRELVDYPADENPEPFIDGWVQLLGVEDVLGTVGRLRARGVPAQPNHVLFATCGCGCGCGPHPADPRANPYYANPYYANPYYANPYYANPYYANPYYANPYYANPRGANPNPGLSQMSDSDTPRSSARPFAGSNPPKINPAGKIRVTVLDTGFAHGDFPAGNITVNGASHLFDIPDAVEIQPDLLTRPTDGVDKLLDPAAGHGTFIAGVIRQNSENCDVTVLRVLSTYGVGDEVELSKQLAGLPRGAQRRPHFVNLSFGGYSPLGMRPLAEAIESLVADNVVVVASAGNDATCLPMYPAALPGVIGVAALDDEDKPAEFTNFGPWVRACALGVDVVSTFFTGFNGDELAEEGVDPDKFDGWAVWSGTSFAAPRVVAALANEMAGPNSDPYEAVKSLIDDPERIRMPMMGTIVAPSNENSWDAVRVAINHNRS